MYMNLNMANHSYKCYQITSKLIHFLIIRGNFCIARFKLQLTEYINSKSDLQFFFLKTGMI